MYGCSLVETNIISDVSTASIIALMQKKTSKIDFRSGDRRISGLGIVHVYTRRVLGFWKDIR